MEALPMTSPHSKLMSIYITELRRVEINFNCDCDPFGFMSDDDDDHDDGVHSDSDNGWPQTDAAGFNSASCFYGAGFTKVTKLLAFDLIPKLKVFCRTK